MLSVPHLIILFVVVLVVFGPHKLPELARGLGKLMAEFRKASTDFRYAFEEEMRNIERQAREVEIKKAQTAAQESATGLPTSQGTPPASSDSGDAVGVEPVIRPNENAVPRSTATPENGHIPEADAAGDSELSQEADPESLEKPLHEH